MTQSWKATWSAAFSPRHSMRKSRSPRRSQTVQLRARGTGLLHRPHQLHGGLPEPAPGTSAAIKTLRFFAVDATAKSATAFKLLGSSSFRQASADWQAAQTRPTAISPIDQSTQTSRVLLATGHQFTVVLPSSRLDGQSIHANRGRFSGSPTNRPQPAFAAAN